MPEDSIEKLIQKLPTRIEEIETARTRVMADVTSYRAYETSFFNTTPSDPTDADSKLRAAIGRYLLGQTNRSSMNLDAVPGDAAAYLRAQAALEMGKWQAVLREIQPVLKSQPKCLPARMLRVEALTQLGNADELAKDLSLVEKDHAESPEVTYIQGLLHELQGEYLEAMRLYGQTLAMDPNHKGALFRQAYHESLRGETETAIDLYERLSALKPVSVGALFNLGLLFEDEEDYQLAAQCFQRILEFDPTHHRARMFLKDASASQTMFYDEERERKEDKRAQVLRIPVTDFELSVRSRNCLANMNVRTLGDLIRLSEAELLAFKNFGETSLHEIKQILSQKGLRLGMVPPESNKRPTGAIDPDSVLARGVSDLDLSVRSRKALDFLNVRTIGELTKISEARLLACKNFGQTSLMEIKKKLADMSLTLAS